MSEGPVILIIDDEIQVRRFLRLSLEAHGYRVREAVTGDEGMNNARMFHPDCIILDLALPDMEGIDVLRKIREWSSTPVIVLSVRNSENDKIGLLDAGANDYLTKPFSIGELLARIRAMMRSVIPDSEQGVFRTGKLAIDFVHRLATLADNEIKLTPTEYSLLCLLARYAGKVITSTQIIREIWGPNFQPDSSYLRVYILQLRRKVEDDPANPKLIITEPGVGYRMLINDTE
jgi:two-component system KDP operon response regulator KdpE